MAANVDRDCWDDLTLSSKERDHLMARFAVYTSDKVFVGYVYASSIREAKRQGRRRYDLIGEPDVFLCREDYHD